MKTIDKEQAFEALTQVVTERGGDFRYTAIRRVCHYQRDGVPSCGVGLALHNAGVSIETLSDMDAFKTDTLGAATSISNLDIIFLLEEQGFKIDTGAVEVFRMFQSRQDEGSRYSDALAATAKLL